MSNKYVPHLQILPEDDANRDMALGFIEHPLVSERHIKALPVAGGWRVAAAKLIEVHLAGLRTFPERRLLLLVDFDGHLDRATEIMASVPADLRPRVFVIGVRSEPERLKANRMGYAEIGERIAQECADGGGEFWDDPLVAHNKAEVERLRAAVRAFLIEGR